MGYAVVVSQDGRQATRQIAGVGSVSEARAVIDDWAREHRPLTAMGYAWIVREGGYTLGGLVPAEAPGGGRRWRWSGYSLLKKRLLCSKVDETAAYYVLRDAFGACRGEELYGAAVRVCHVHPVDRVRAAAREVIHGTRDRERLFRAADLALPGWDRPADPRPLAAVQAVAS